MRFVGICGPKLTKATDWGDGDVLGYLLVEQPDGWYLVATHYCSSPSYAESDIRRHFDTRSKPFDDDTYEWVGQLSREDMRERFPAGAKLSELSGAQV